MRVTISSARPLPKAMLSALLCACALSAHATLVTFDDLPWQPSSNDPSFSDQPVTDQYAAQGMLIDVGYLARGEHAYSAPQYLLAGNGAHVSFTGVLPLYVSLYFSSVESGPGGVETSATATGPGGFLQTVSTGGYQGADDGSPLSTPFPNTYASFASPGGISDLFFGNYYNLRVVAFIDNIYFGAVSPVPEPASLAMMGIGLAGMLMWRRQRAAVS